MAGPLDMRINREVLNVMLTHLTIPASPDGACRCGDEEAVSEHGADHLINELVKYFKLPWKRVYDKKIDGLRPPAWCE